MRLLTAAPNKGHAIKHAQLTQQLCAGRTRTQTERDLREIRITTTGENLGNAETIETRWMIPYTKGSLFRDGTLDATSVATNNKIKQENLGATAQTQETKNYTTESLFRDGTRNVTSIEANNRIKPENLGARTQETKKLRS